MRFTPLKNNLTAKNSPRSLTLYSGCCCCCCCVLAPVGSYIAENIMRKKFPERPHFWRHVVVNTGISIGSILAASFIFTIFTLIQYKLVASFRIYSYPLLQIFFFVARLAVIFLIAYVSFYGYSFVWLPKDTPKEKRRQAVFSQTLWSVLLVGLFFTISYIAGAGLLLTSM